jgi:23S rRNA pseudouridine1911/1915/1917 synthase
MMETKTFTIDQELSGGRLDKALVTFLVDKTRNHIATLIESGQVSVDGKVTTKVAQRVKQGQIVIIDFEEAVEPEVDAENIPLDIIFEDQDIIVIDKKAGMVVHPAIGHTHGTLVNALMYHCHDLSGINGIKRPGIVHRIDKDTSGLIVACKNDFAHEKVATQLEDHSMHREYYAIVKGVIIETDGKVVAPIGRDFKDRLKMGVDIAHGKEAITYFHVLERFNQYTFVSCRLLTGRTHQIRVHMAFIGHGIEGDQQYGKGKNLIYDQGQLLHAYRLTLKHPRTEQIMTFEAPLPEYFKNVLVKLKK